MVFEAYAAAYPWTMMIHLEHTPLTQTAVMSPGWLDKLALVAKPKVYESFKLQIGVGVS